MVDMGPDSDNITGKWGDLPRDVSIISLVMGQEATPIYEAFQEVKKPAEQYFDFAALHHRLKELMSPGDVVLVKASRCVHMENLFTLLYPEGMENRELNKEAPQIFWPERGDMFKNTTRSEDRKCAAKPTPVKTDFTITRWINAPLNC